MKTSTPSRLRPGRAPLRPFLTFLLAGVTLLAAAPPRRSLLLPADLVGTWVTEAQLAGPLRTGHYPDCDPEDWQPLVLSIAEDGSVTGGFGGAGVMRGRLEVDPGWVRRWVGARPAYLVRGDLAGPITTWDGEVVRRFTLPCRLENGALQGVIKLASRRTLTRPLILEKAAPPGGVAPVPVP